MLFTSKKEAAEKIAALEAEKAELSAQVEALTKDLTEANQTIAELEAEDDEEEDDDEEEEDKKVLAEAIAARDEALAKATEAIALTQGLDERIEKAVSLKLKEELAKVGVEPVKAGQTKSDPYEGLKGKALARAVLNDKFRERGITK